MNKKRITFKIKKTTKLVVKQYQKKNLSLSPMRHLLARLLDLVIQNGVRQMGQMNQLLRIWRGILLQERGHLVPPRRDRPPAPPSPSNTVSTDSGQQQLEDVLTEDQTVPAVGLEEEHSLG